MLLQQRCLTARSGQSAQCLTNMAILKRSSWGTPQNMRRSSTTRSSRAERSPRSSLGTKSLTRWISATRMRQCGRSPSISKRERTLSWSKPGMFYLDIVYRAKKQFGMPLAVYNVSGECSMIKAGAAAGYLDEKSIRYELLTSFKRAGADLIITYFAKEAARQL